MNRSVKIAIIGMLLSKEGLAQSPEGPPAELSQMQFLLGTWKCLGRTLATPLGPESAVETSIALQTKRNEFWYTVRYETKTKESSQPSKGFGILGFDPGSKNFTIISMESTGATYSQGSPGFVNNKAEWTGEMRAMGKKLPYREMYFKKSNVEMSTLMEISLREGVWIKASELACKKN